MKCLWPFAIHPLHSASKLLGPNFEFMFLNWKDIKLALSGGPLQLETLEWVPKTSNTMKLIALPRSWDRADDSSFQPRYQNKLRTWWEPFLLPFSPFVFLCYSFFISIHYSVIFITHRIFPFANVAFHNDSFIVQSLPLPPQNLWFPFNNSTVPPRTPKSVDFLYTIENKSLTVLLLTHVAYFPSETSISPQLPTQGHLLCWQGGWL